ncbi:hypothetical protein, partial [Rhodanobacter sp. MP7CTX1]|uniref:hypothetical protein n=1 Tax=Rhodanobacter sp. MP7CTX1 TaxID=2723084 RepID=UPI001C88B5BF
SPLAGITGSRYGSPMAKAPTPRDRVGGRVNLTLPPEVDLVLGRLAEAAGTGKASFVREWLVSMTPQLVQMAEALEAAKAGQMDSLSMMSKTLRGAVQGGQQAQLELTKLRAVVRKRKLLK